MFNRSRVPTVEPLDAAARQERGAVLVDVRDDDEWAAGHAPAAVHVPLSRLSTALADLRGRDVLAVCRSGSRSAAAVTALERAGVSVRNVAGGMSRWSACGLPVVRDDGSRGVVI